MRPTNSAVLKESNEVRNQWVEIDPPVPAQEDKLRERLAQLFGEMDVELVTHSKEVLAGHNKNITVLLFSPVKFEDYSEMRPAGVEDLAGKLARAAIRAKMPPKPLGKRVRGWTLIKRTRGQGVPILIARAVWV